MNFAKKITPILLTCSTLIISPIQAEVTKFVVWGDTPYNHSVDVDDVDNLIDAMDTLNIEFSIHVGDIKSGSSSPCNDSTLTVAYDLFQQSHHPVIYTPGDNEWTDCSRSGFDPLERLDFIRGLYFESPKQSLGQNTIPLATQADERGMTRYIENARWTENNFVFATVHMPGSNNAKSIDGGEFRSRNYANRKWLSETFAQAKANNNVGVVLSMQANMWPNRGSSDGFTEFKALFEQEVKDFAKPVLLVHGDTHYCRFNAPGSKSNPLPSLSNLWRVEVFKQPIDGVIISLDPESSRPFSADSVLGNDCQGI
ncbi:hypothetical protein [Colwellia psychrerythraea]|uniref:Calcineurin-like phosphoesterase domain-containing protein n=1 Tax=Colwellia psychrerythraea TaxID=28229 RepID=A0A099L6P3_COLPS|nr:hypothetical protein [Colwellia psychrerythraea]KGJ97553.1 hypothetical protein GAB14E_1142 [Colwellia psychrerythraea]